MSKRRVDVRRLLAVLILQTAFYVGCAGRDNPFNTATSAMPQPSQRDIEALSAAKSGWWLPRYAELVALVRRSPDSIVVTFKNGPEADAIARITLIAIRTSGLELRNELPHAAVFMDSLTGKRHDETIRVRVQDADGDGVPDAYRLAVSGGGSWDEDPGDSSFVDLKASKAPETAIQSWTSSMALAVNKLFYRRESLEPPPGK